MRESPALEVGLNLGKLVYQGSPTAGSVIVYSSARDEWGRVPMQDVNVNVDMSHQPFHRLLGILRADRVAQCMLMVLVLALMFVGIGSYGFSKNASRRAGQPTLSGLAALGEASPSVKRLALHGEQDALQGSVEPLRV
jgi:hypothetical protein